MCLTNSPSNILLSVVLSSSYLNSWPQHLHTLPNKRSRTVRNLIGFDMPLNYSYIHNLKEQWDLSLSADLGYIYFSLVQYLGKVIETRRKRDSWFISTASQQFLPTQCHLPGTDGGFLSTSTLSPFIFHRSFRSVLSRSLHNSSVLSWTLASPAVTHIPNLNLHQVETCAMQRKLWSGICFSSSDYWVWQGWEGRNVYSRIFGEYCYRTVSAVML